MSIIRHIKCILRRLEKFSAAAAAAAATAETAAGKKYLNSVKELVDKLSTFREPFGEERVRINLHQLLPDSTHTHAHAPTHTHTRMHMRTHTHTRTCAHTHISTTYPHIIYSNLDDKGKNLIGRRRITGCLNS